MTIDPTPPPTDSPWVGYHKEIVRDHETRDYAMYLSGELIGFARTYQEAVETLDQVVFELLSASYVREQPL